MKDPFEKAWHGIGVGGSTALDFVNTLDWRLRERPVELLKTFPDLLRWGRSAGVLGPGEARRLRRWSLADPRTAGRALARAAEVREAIAALFQAMVGGRDLPPGPLARLEAACRAAGGARSLRAGDGGAAWAWRDASPEPDRPAWAAALDAARILTSAERALLRQCGDAECGWFFLDTSRNRTRRWCSMLACGNRNKARRFYRRAAAKRSRPPRARRQSRATPSPAGGHAR
jgi:predicted RNA-binding Zn ribbon-like protein